MPIFLSKLSASHGWDAGAFPSAVTRLTGRLSKPVHGPAAGSWIPALIKVHEPLPRFSCISTSKTGIVLAIVQIFSMKPFVILAV